MSPIDTMLLRGRAVTLSTVFATPLLVSGAK